MKIMIAKKKKYLVHIEIDLSPLWKLKIEKYFWMLGLFLW